MQDPNLEAQPRAVKLVPCPRFSSLFPTPSVLVTTMSSTPLMKSEGRASDDDYSDSGQIPLNHRRRQLLRKENIGWACLFAVLLAVTIGLSAGVAVVVVLSWQNRGPAFSQSFAPSPITRDVDITFHETRFDGNFMEENIYRKKGNNETDAAWAALGIDCGFAFWRSPPPLLTSIHRPRCSRPGRYRFVRRTETRTSPNQ